MPAHKTILRLLCLLLFCNAALAQTPALPGYTLQIFGAADGLLSSEIRCLHQDAKDFMWIGTRGGVSRYDGKRFQNFEYVNNNRIGAVHQIAEDESKTVWLSTETGLYRWSDKSFIHLSFPDEAAHLPFNALHFTAEGEVWIGTAKGPVHFASPQNMAGQSLAKNIISGWEVIAKSDGAITSVGSSKKGVVFGAFASVYLYQNKALKKLPNPIQGNEYLRGVFIDDEGGVYWNNVLTGFHYWNGKEMRIPAAGDAFYFDIFCKQGAMFLYTNGGIKKVDNTTKNSTTMVNLWPLELRSPSCLFMDKEGAWWAGTAEGVFHIEKNGFTIYNSRLPYTDDLYSLLRRRNGKLLIGANRGRIFEMSDSFRVYKKLPQIVPLAEVFAMHEDNDGALWFGTGYQGITLFKNSKQKNFTTKNGLPDNTHCAFLQTSKNVLWTCGDWGLTRITPLTKDSFAFKPFFYFSQAGYHKLYGMVEAPDGSIWAGGQLGLFHLENDSLQLYSLPEMRDQKLSITAIKTDKYQNVWLATRGNGILLCRFGPDNRLHLKQQWREEAGTNTNTYLSLAFDDNGNVWGGSYNGVTALVAAAGHSYTVKNFDAKDGFLKKHYESLRLFADGKNMWACTSSGAVSFTPAELLAQPRTARISITAIDLLNTKKNASGFFVKDEKGLAYSFPANVNSFSVRFAAPYYSNPDAVRYYYQLKGVDSSWTSTGNEQTILFRQLPAGQYTLLVKAAIGGSNWTNTATLLFQIKKPWWLQWWAIASAVVIMAALFFYTVRNREKKLQQQERQKTEWEKLKAVNYKHQLEIEQVTTYFATSLNEHTTVDAVLWDVARNCISRLGFEDCVIYLKKDAGDGLVQQAAWGPKTTHENKIVAPIEILLGQGIVGSVAQSGKAEKIDDTTNDCRYIVDDVARASEITVPIFDESGVIGVIDSEHSQKGFYTDRHLHILTTIASHCSAKISTLKAEAKTATARMDALLSKQKALEASLQSMRLQMNPHFLFNALNSIQQMILAGEEITATRFLSKFSKLLRTVLTNSDKEEISLKEEVELLQLYVDLESLRFKESFRFSLHMGEEIDADELKVPALFFQPMVENAIWHGLMHKEGARKLFIGFEEVANGGLLCTIEDNGVGRHSSRINGDGDHHTGKGLRVAKERLKALNEKNGTANELAVIDLKGKDGMATGTRIRILLYPQ